MTPAKKSGKKTPGKSPNRTRKAAGTVEPIPKKNKKKQIKKTEKPGKKRGTPSKYNPDQHPFMAWALAIKGKTNEEIAAALSVSRPTLWAWGRAHPDFLNALKSGKDIADAKVENSLFMRAFGYEYEEVKTKEEGSFVRTEKTVKHVPGDVTAMIFWLKNRRPGEWRDVNKQEHSGPDGTPIPLVGFNIEKILGTDDYREYERRVFNSLSTKPTDAGS